MSRQLIAAQEFLLGMQGEAQDDKQALIIAKCRGLIEGYDARWARSGYVVDKVEGLVESSLWNPESGRVSRSFRVAGKLDVTGHMGRRVIFDHKSTSEDITDPNAPYWRQLVIEGQVSHYMLLEWLNGRKAEEAVWDVMRKPAIRPKEIAKKDREFVERSGLYFGREVGDASIDHMRATEREDLAMYGYRLAFDCTETRPDWYFQRKTVLRLDADIHEYATELWGHAQDILHARRENRWPRNSGACFTYGTPCKFLGLCSGFDTPDSDKWKRKEQVHSELPLINGDGRDILTNSRIRCFQTCRRKHYYTYELGIDRQDEEEREALYFGTLWHLVLEVWFNASKGEAV